MTPSMVPTPHFPSWRFFRRIFATGPNEDAPPGAVRRSSDFRTGNIRVMRLPDGVEWGVHVCTLLASLPEDAALPASKLAEYHGVPAAYLAKHLQALAAAGVLRTVKGAKGGYRLARPPQEISVLEVVEA